MQVLVVKKLTPVSWDSNGISSFSPDHDIRLAQEVIKSLEQEIYESADNLEYEWAAVIRNKNRETKEDSMD